MKAITFKGANCVYAEEQDEYLNLPAHKTKGGEVTSCYRLSFMERMRVLFTGKIFFTLLTFNKPLQPQRASTIFGGEE